MRFINVTSDFWHLCPKCNTPRGFYKPEEGNWKGASQQFLAEELVTIECPNCGPFQVRADELINEARIRLLRGTTLLKVCLFPFFEYPQFEAVVLAIRGLDWTHHS